MTNQVNDNWYEDFFQGINCELWENAIPTEATKQEVDFLLNELNLQKGQHILDVPMNAFHPQNSSNHTPP
jgi:cyclopropane fatty-acyl-phospholipid synthase-like methyltransferase